MKKKVKTKPDPTFKREAMKSELWHLKFTNQYNEEEYVFSLGIDIDGTDGLTLECETTQEDGSKKNSKKYAVCNLCHDQGKW